MKTAIVPISEVAAQPGMPLTADYWCTRQDAESYPAWRLRTKAENRERAARRHERIARRLRREAKTLRQEIDDA